MAIQHHHQFIMISFHAATEAIVHSLWIKRRMFFVNNVTAARDEQSLTRH